MVKSYMKLIGIFQGKQATHNTQILNLLYDEGPLTAWEIAGKISPRSRISLHATLNKRLRSLENKGYVKRAAKKWCLQFKGIIAALLIQKTPRPLCSKWAELIENCAKYLDDDHQALSDLTIQGSGVTIHPLETIKKTGQTLRAFDDWVALSAFVKGLIQTGVVNFDVISNETLFAVIMTEATHQQLEDVMKEWNIQNADLNKISPNVLSSSLTMIKWATPKKNHEQKQCPNRTAPVDYKLTSPRTKAKTNDSQLTTRSSKT